MSQTDTIRRITGFGAPFSNNILGGNRTYHKMYLVAKDERIIKM